MEFLSDDATYLVVGLAVLAVGFLLALKISQQGKFLVWAIVAAVLALMALLIEQLWVTDAERIEKVVYALRDAAVDSDSARVLELLAPNIQYEQREHTLLKGERVRAFIGQQLNLTRFDFIRITHLQTSAGRQSGRGSAEFRVLTSGTYEAGGPINFGSARLDFSLGLHETSPQVWKVDRMTLTRGPRGMPVPSGASERRPGSPYSGPRREY